LLLHTDIFEDLVATDGDITLGDGKGEFILLDFAQLRELEAANIGADDGRELSYLDGGI